MLRLGGFVALANIKIRVRLTKISWFLADSL